MVKVSVIEWCEFTGLRVDVSLLVVEWCELAGHRGVSLLVVE